MNERNGWMAGWTDVNPEHHKSSSPVDDLVLWHLLINAGLGAMVGGGAALRGSCVPLRNPWMAGVSASGLSSVLSLWEQTWCYRAALPSVCSKEVACSHESLLVIYLWRKLEFQGSLIEETFRGKRRNHMWHHMPGPGSPCPCPDPNHQPKSETGYPTPFSPLFVPCWPCFSRETVLIYNGWLVFFFLPQRQRIWYMCPMWKALKRMSLMRLFVDKLTWLHHIQEPENLPSPSLNCICHLSFLSSP